MEKQIHGDKEESSHGESKNESSTVNVDVKIDLELEENDRIISRGEQEKLKPQKKT